MLKNVASQKWRVFAFGGPGHANEGEPITGDAAQITAKLSKDGGTLTATNDTNPTELESGWYEFDMTQAETNADELFLVAVSSTTNVEVIAAPATHITSINTQQMNATSVIGNGTSGNKWRG